MNRIGGNFLDFENSCLAARIPLFAEIVVRKDWVPKDRILWTLAWCEAFPDDHFVFLDPWDTLCVGDPAAIEYEAHKQLLLFPADSYCWPLSELKDEYDKRRKAVSPWCFINGAGPAGQGKYIAEAIRWGLEKFDFTPRGYHDATFWTYVYLRGGFGELDQLCRLTQQLYGATEGAFKYGKESVFNTVTGSSPQFLHASGHSWDMIPEELILPRREPRA